MRKSNVRSLQILSILAFVYLLFVCLFEFPLLPPSTGGGSGEGGSATASGGGGGGGSAAMNSQEDLDEKLSPVRPNRFLKSSSSLSSPRLRSPWLSGLRFPEFESGNANISELHRAAKTAWSAGADLLSELQNLPSPGLPPPRRKPNGTSKAEACPHYLTLSGADFTRRKNLMAIPCGLTLGSHLTVVGRPRPAHPERDPKITEGGEEPVMVSQFMMELQGLRAVDGEDPPRILHFNPRIKGDWSNLSVIEQNSCYRMQWGSAQRCDGWRSRADEETVDGLVKCEKWIRDDDNRSEESKTAWWLNRLIGRTKKVSFDWPYPFVEDKLFVLTLSAGLEGYHVNVDGRHVTSFPYRTGFVLEDATGFSLNGDLDVLSIFAASLPTSHPSYAPQRNLEMSAQWQALPLPDGPIELFIGILSAGNHFAERMAVRKSWMSTVRKSSSLVARFFVALHGRKEVNMELKKEAEFFGDIVILPYMDSYDLVVLKTIAICEYGLRTVSAKYIMKCDDDTFVRIDSVTKEAKKVPSEKSLYMGNMNYYHKPLRNGKWAVTYEEWPGEDYPPYANGPGYVVSSDIAHFVVSEFERQALRLFKMEDVSMGMWVEQFNATKPVEYVHSLKFCQFGCIYDYFTAHYQSPRQMLCMWDKLLHGRPQCCNMK